MNPEESRQRKFVHPVKSNWQSMNVLELRRWLLGVRIDSRMTSFDLMLGLLMPAIVNNRSAIRGRRKEMFHFYETARSAVTPTQPPDKWVQRALPTWIQWTVHEADRSPPCIDEVIEWVALYFHSPLTRQLNLAPTQPMQWYNRSVFCMEVCFCAFRITDPCSTLHCS